MSRAPDRTKSLDQLDPPAWGEPTFDSYLVKRCHRLRTKPVGDFTVEDLRMMIGQQIGLEHLVPLAIEVLERNPLAAGNYYPGDLLNNVLTINDALWLAHPLWRERLSAVLASWTDVPEDVREAVALFLARAG
jgi:hypothetical protein